MLVLVLDGLCAAMLSVGLPCDRERAWLDIEWRSTAIRSGHSIGNCSNCSRGEVVPTNGGEIMAGYREGTIWRPSCEFLPIGTSGGGLGRRINVVWQYNSCCEVRSGGKEICKFRA